jgi:hypothetical protein
MLDLNQIQSFIACCNQCEEYKKVYLQLKGTFLISYCKLSGESLSNEPKTVSIPSNCPKGLGYAEG